MYNKLYLLNEQPKKNLIKIPIIILIITFIIFIYRYKTYNSFLTTGFIKCDNKCYINISLPYDKADKITLNSKIEYLNNIYNIEKIEFKEPYIENNIAYQDIKIYSELQTEKRIINLKLLYNKQRIITKIKELILKGE